MGWWPSFLGGSSSDPVKNLDPKLRDFLEKESPLKYPPKQSPSAPSQAQREALADIKGSSSEPSQPSNAVPAESLYQDGRYAHLWKNYRPQAQVEAETMSDHDRLMNVLDAFNQRKTNISRIAMENCAEQQEEWVNCMKYGKWEDQLQMCRHQVRKFEKCYTMQSRFLRALGYGSDMSRSSTVDEEIQMHADSLYQRVLAHEAAVEAARENGTPIPVFNPAIPNVSKVTVQPSEEVRQQWDEALEKLPAEERAAEEAALRADLQAKTDVAKSMRQFYDNKKKKSKEEEDRGVERKTVAEQLWDRMTGK